MALVTFSRSFYWPQVFRTAGGDPTGEFGTTALNASGHRFGWVFTAPVGGSWEGFGFRTGSVTTARDTDARAETVGSDANPTGTLVATGAQVTIPAASITANTWITATFGTAPTIAAGDELAAVLAPTSTPNYQTANRLIRHLESFWPAGRFWGGSSWTHLPNWLVFAVRIDGTWIFLPGAIPIASHQNVLFRTGQSPSEVGVYLTPSVRLRTVGFLVSGFSFMSDGTTATVRVRALDNTVLAESTGWRGGMRTALGSNASQLRGRWASPTTLEPNITYRLVIEGTSSTDNCRLQYQRLPSTAYATAMPQGSGHYRTERSGSGSWTDTDTDYANMALEIDAVEGGETVLVPRRTTYFA
jgi:hypothetical protein